VIAPYVPEYGEKMFALDETIAILAAVVKSTEGFGASAELVRPPHAERALQRG
jgi:hypothetical protein